MTKQLWISCSCALAFALAVAWATRPSLPELANHASSSDLLHRNHSATTNNSRPSAVLRTSNLPVSTAAVNVDTAQASGIQEVVAQRSWPQNAPTQTASIAGSPLPASDASTAPQGSLPSIQSVSWETKGWPQDHGSGFGSMSPASYPQPPASYDGVIVPQADCGVNVGSTLGNPPDRMMLGVDGNCVDPRQREAQWSDQRMVPWESFAYGEYIGPPRTPHVNDYRLRIGDRVDFVYLLDRGHNNGPYQIYSGDTLSISSIADPSLNQPSLTVLSDGTIALQLIGQVQAAGKTLEALSRELNQRFQEFVRKPDIVVQVVKGDTPLNDLRDAVDARAGQGGQSREVTVSPDGVVRLPLIGPVPAIGLSLDEIAAEVNARYAQRLRGISVTPILVQRAPRSIFVLGQVNRPGRIELQGPTSVMQAIAMAEGWRTGSNLRQIIVFRRDANWQLVATKIDLQGALNGRRPHPADEIWLRDADIVLVPKTPVQRFSEAVDLYLAKSLYAIFPQQGIVFNFDGFQSF